MPIYLHGARIHEWKPPVHELGEPMGLRRIGEDVRPHIAAGEPFSIAVNAAVALHLTGIETPGRKFVIRSTVTNKGHTSDLLSTPYVWPSRKSGMIAVMFLECQFAFSENTIFTFNFLLDGEPLVQLSLPIVYGSDYDI